MPTNFTSLQVGGVPTMGVGQFITGQVFFVDPELGSDGNEGSAERPMASIGAAYDRCVSGRGDVVVLKGGPTSAGTTGHTNRLSATLTWAKHNTHLVGAGAPTMVGQRARITGPSSGGTFSPLMSVTGSGCMFANFTIFDDYTVDPVAIKMTGSRNYFYNVNIQGMGHTDGAADAAGCSLWLAGASENTFEKCVIGLDTVARNAANAEIKFTAAATRNIFLNCSIVSETSGATHLFVDASASGCIDRYVEFRDCTFTNAKTGISGGLTMTNAMSVHASAGGYILLTGTTSMVGATDWAAADNANVFVRGTAATAGSDGIMLAVTR